MEHELFSTEIKDRLVALENAADVVEFSFIAQPSISYLDLQLCKNSPTSDYFGSPSEHSARSRLKSYVNTEERFRKFFIPSRRLLYTLHLDLTKEREHSLKDVPKFVQYGWFSNSRHVAQIIFSHRSEMISNLIIDAFDVNVPRIKIFEMIMDMPSLSLVRQLSFEIVYEFLKCFYPKIPNSRFFKNFIRNIDIVVWTDRSECPKTLEYLLKCVRCHGNIILEDNFASEFVLGTSCLYGTRYRSIGPFLKFAPAYRINEDDYDYFLSEITELRPTISGTLLENMEEWMMTESSQRIVQLLYIYEESFMDGNAESASEALGLIWKSIPDPYLTYDELKAVFGDALLEELEIVHDFYKQAVGDSCENLDPRSLKHLCRTALRNALWENKLWIPEGIQRLPLPKSLQLYLNLDQSLSIPETSPFQ